MFIKHFAARVFATANATTETEYAKMKIGQFSVESVKRGVYATDFMAWIDCDRKIWGAGKTRQDAIDSAVKNADNRGFFAMMAETENLPKK